ncbi:GmrSD restriction endonuclease domain-containing protein [Desulfonatronovibrio magnus]|uniref:GmrSD restriction endonuclease domain-containing protein n=1 Tax=Desulfonatronovibrio magnus TaxID=698827 RepID=UPI0005EB1C35|nr:DUF262 domain-containing protein [Desulfonatronovibrio magnus]
MTIQKYSVNQYTIQTLLTWVESKDIAIPEIQRPFVWSATKVREFIDSLYSGYPVGYLIAWRNPAVRLKDGSTSDGKRILIDGQQRVTALMAAILGMQVVDKNYRKTRIKISFHPAEKRFEVFNPAIGKDKQWIHDISEVLSPNAKMLQLVNDYCERNPGNKQDDVYESLSLLKGIVNNHIGLIELNSDLDIETVTEIFIRINSSGVVLSQADFAMSKIAANEIYGGNNLRKCIDYFCHLLAAPEFYDQIAQVDKDFSSTDYFRKMAWLRNENDDLYEPSYTDALRVAFISEFRRGRLEDLVALLSGRNFETRDFEEAIAQSSFASLEKGIFNFMHENHFKRFLMIIRSAGFVDSTLIRSQNTLNMAYAIYLVMRSNQRPAPEIESCVRRWFVMSVLTGRYSSSPESAMDYDVKLIHENGVRNTLDSIEEAELSDAFWKSGLPQQMRTSVASSPYFKVYLASQVFDNDKGFLSRDITVRDLITHRGDVHHLFPKKYLKKHGLTKGKYNQIANYVMMQSEINISIGAQEPSRYFSCLLEQCSNGNAAYGAITDRDQLAVNFKLHCIPEDMDKMTIDHYEDFLKERRKLMAQKIKDFYFRL